MELDNVIRRNNKMRNKFWDYQNSKNDKIIDYGNG